MIVAIDIGNSKIAFGIFQHNTLISQRRISSSPVQSEAGYLKEIHSLCETIKSSPQQIEGIVIASVVPTILAVIIGMIQHRLNITSCIVSGKLELGIKIHYEDPSMLGADRICNVVAAYKQYGGPAIVVSLGTATTYDVIAHNGDFLGGVIAPGVMTAGANLHQMTAQLPAGSLSFPKQVVSNNTKNSIEAGIAFNAIDGIEGITRRIKSELGTDAAVIGTGGLIESISPHTGIFKHIEPYLVLQGAYLIYQSVRNSQ